MKSGLNKSGGQNMFLAYTLRNKGSKGVLKLSSQEDPQRFNKELKKVL